MYACVTQTDIIYDYNSLRMNYEIMTFTVWGYIQGTVMKKKMLEMCPFISRDVPGTGGSSLSTWSLGKGAVGH